MEDMIRRLTDMEKETKTLNETAMPAPGVPQVPVEPASQGTPVSINVSMNASGKEHVADLLDMMKNAGLGGAQEVSPDMMPMRQDMERLRGLVDEPAPESDSMEPSCGMEDIQSEEELDEYENEPDPDYQDHKYMTKDLSGGLNREKKAYAAAQDGDNAMAVEAGHIKQELLRALGEKRAKESSDESQVDEISADTLRSYRDKAQADIGKKQKDLRSRVPSWKIPQGKDADLEKKIKDRGEQKSKAVQKLMKKDPTPAPKKGEKYPLGGRDPKSGRSYSS